MLGGAFITPRMAELIDFEALIGITKLVVSKEKTNDDIQEIPSESLIDVLDKMCETANENETTSELNDADEKHTNAVADTLEDFIDLGEFENINNEMCISTETMNKLSQKEFNINNLIENERNKEPANEILKQAAEEIASNGIIANLDEFDDTFNVFIDDINEIKKKDNMLEDNVVKIEQNAGTVTVTATDLVKIPDKVNDNITRGVICNDELVKTKKDELKHYVTLNRHSELFITLKHEPLKINKIMDSKTIKAEVKNEDNSTIDTTIVSIEPDIISISSTEDSDDDGYNSSDFEFITESEARKQCLSKTTLESTHYYNADYMRYHKSRYVPCKLNSERQAHVIPQGDSYLDLFRGMYAPAVMNNLYFATKKQVLPATSMTVQTDGFGFDVFENKSEDIEYKGEADDTVKKIHFLYPYENRRKRRRL